METEFQLDDAIIEAKLKVLQELKDFIHTNDALATTIRNISIDHDLKFKELWSWAVEQLLSDDIIATTKEKRPPLPQTNIKVTPTKYPPTVVRRPKPKDEVTKFQESSVESRIQTVKTTTDQKIIAAGIVDINRLVRLEAIKNEETPEKLIKMVVNEDANLKVQRVAIRYIQDQEFLKNIAFSSKTDLEVRQKSIRKLKDKKLLNDICQGNHPSTLIKAAGLTIYELA